MRNHTPARTTPNSAAASVHIDASTSAADGTAAATSTTREPAPTVQLPKHRSKRERGRRSRPEVTQHLDIEPADIVGLVLRRHPLETKMPRAELEMLHTHRNLQVGQLKKYLCLYGCNNDKHTDSSSDSPDTTSNACSISFQEHQHLEITLYCDSDSESNLFCLSDDLTVGEIRDYVSAIAIPATKQTILILHYALRGH